MWQMCIFYVICALRILCGIYAFIIEIWRHVGHGFVCSFFRDCMHFTTMKQELEDRKCAQKYVCSVGRNIFLIGLFCCFVSAYLYVSYAVFIFPIEIFLTDYFVFQQLFQHGQECSHKAWMCLTHPCNLRISHDNPLPGSPLYWSVTG